MSTLLLLGYLAAVPLGWVATYRFLYRDLGPDYDGVDRFLGCMLSSLFCWMWPLLLVAAALALVAERLEDQ